MLMKPTPVRPPPSTYAHVGGRDVRLAHGLSCPHCARVLQAYDVRIDDGDVWLGCGGCHRVLLLIGVPER
jgi:hypothetical protein